MFTEKQGCSHSIKSKRQGDKMSKNITHKEFKSSKLIKSKALYDFILPLLTKDNDTGYYIFNHPRGKVYITFYDGYIEEFENYEEFRKADLYE